MIEFLNRCILTLLFCIAIQSTEDVPEKWKDMLKLGSNYDERIEFFTRTICLLGISTDPAVQKKMQLNENLNTYVDRNLPECLDTIGFLPLTNKRVQMFVTAGSNLKSSYKGIEIKLKDETVLTCTPEPKTVPGNPAAFSVIVPVELSSDTILKGNNPIQCPAVFLTPKDGNVDLYGILKDGEWTFTVTFCCNEAKKAETCVSGSSKECKDEYKGNFDTKNIISKKFCEFDRLQLSNNGDKHKTYKQLTKVKGDLDKIEKSDKSLFSGESRVTNEACTDGHSMTYKITKEGDSQIRTGFATEVDCKKKSDKFLYLINTPKGIIDVADDEAIELECSQYKCRTCEKPNNATCPSDTGSCTYPFSVNKHTSDNDNAKCYELDTSKCKSGILLLNGKIEKILQSDAKSVKCNDDSKFMLNNQIITNVSCLGTFSALKYPLSDTPPPGLTKKDVKTKKPVNCAKPDTGCECDTNDKQPELNNLAFANKNGSDWLRINSLIFNFSIGMYEYSRTTENGTKFHTFNPERAVQCIAAIPLPREEDRPKHPDSSIVIGANIGIIVAFAAITVPGVIFFVNNRIKKREAHKAAKKNKKKEDGSEEKKEGENKGVNENEKKNQA